MKKEFNGVTITREVQITPAVKKVKVTQTFLGKDIRGPVELLKKVKAVVGVNWEGNVERLFKCSMDKVDPDWFTPSDKGGLSAFGIDKDGKVICGMVYYDQGTHEVKTPHYEIVACSSTQTHPWF
jgi:hypothetical protein